MPIKFLGGLLVSACLIWPALAQPQVKVTDLGMPQCATITRTPDFASDLYDGNQYNEQTIVSPWRRWPVFYNKNAQFNGLVGVPTKPAGALYRFATPQTAVTFVIGNPDAHFFFHFWSGGNIIATINGTAIGSSSTDYYVQLSLNGNNTFDAFSFEIKPTQWETLAYADFDAVCQ